MLQEYKTKTNLFILHGIIAQVVGGMMSQDIGGLISVIGYVLCIIGCYYYAMGKGHNGAWGLFGLLSLIGLIVLVCLRDKHKENTASCKYCGAHMPDNSIFCPSCGKRVASTTSSAGNGVEKRL